MNTNKNIDLLKIELNDLYIQQEKGVSKKSHLIKNKKKEIARYLTNITKEK